MITYRRFLSLQAGAIMLTHELNNYTMSEAIKWYPSLRAAFNVNFSNLFLFKNTDLLVRTVRRPSWSGVEQDSAVRREHAYSTVILTMSVTFLNTAKVSKRHIFFYRFRHRKYGPGALSWPRFFRGEFGHHIRSWASTVDQRDTRREIRDELSCFEDSNFRIGIDCLRCVHRRVNWTVNLVANELWNYWTTPDAHNTY